jgi:hypothetical protein
MSCDNKVSYWIASSSYRGYSHREYIVTCGKTDPYGDRAICESCSNDPSIMKAIQDHEDLIEADNAWLRSSGWGEA